MREYLTVEQVAKRFSVTRVTILNWVRRGDFPKPFRISRRLVRWDAEDIDNFIDKQKSAQCGERIK